MNQGKISNQEARALIIITDQNFTGETTSVSTWNILFYYYLFGCLGRIQMNLRTSGAG
jgi:hypothetical protein